ncbi:MAG: Holliday junction branch migration protein RuvA [Casimicrobiaceae bacterium]|nr:Holliday junction branch migration protein RuvA [Casimicrobiaceae bacterium]MCX8099279.1 Holliday junction branch migration protein RuvA [Casimicrobiaceae bacterium]MDW8313032.1 Holliday junction branch migration protein RuvA [Burkholderiales bacterium]
MIGRIQGTLVAKQPPTIAIDTPGGVGYELDVPMSTFYALPATGERVELLTQLIVREDAQLLFGFATREEREAFRALLKVSGVGPKAALAVLSGLSVAELAQTIAAQDAKRLMRIPGIGHRTAERLLLELRGKPLTGALTTSRGHAGGAACAPVAGHEANTNAQDVLHALLALGYSEREALAACRDLPADLPLAEAIRAALRILAAPPRK